MTLLIYLVAGAAIALVAKFLERPLDGKVLAILCVLPLLFLFPGAFSSKTILPVDQVRLFPPWNGLGATGTPRNPNLNDVATQFVPWAKAVRLAWKERSLPLRNRWNGCGTALAANGSSAVFSPLTFLMFLLPLANAFTLAAAVKLLIALTGMWLWLRELGVSHGAAIFGAVTFSFSFTMTPWLLFPHTAAICLWPWALFLAERIHRGAAASRGFWPLAVLLAMISLAGHIESAASLALFWFSWLASRRLMGERAIGAATAKLITAAVVALGLSAFFLLPQVFAILASNRFVLARKPLWSDFFSLAPHLPVWPKGVVTTLFPRALGDGISSPMIPGAAGSFPEMALGYCSVVVAIGILLSLRPGSPRNGRAVALFLPLLFGLGIATGCWPAAEIAGHIPLIKMMLPLRLLSWIALAGPAIAAAEIDRFCADLSRGRIPLLGFAVASASVASLAVSVYLHFRPLHAATGGLHVQRNALVITLLVAGAAMLATTLASFRPRALSALPLVLAVITGVELFRQGQSLYRFGSPAELFPSTPLIRFLAKQAPHYRVVGDGSAVYPNTNVFAGLEDIRTHDPLERRDYVEFLDVTAGYAPGEYFKHVANLDASVLSFLNVRYLVAAPGQKAPGERWLPVYTGQDGVVFENRQSLPRALVTPRVHLLRPAVAPSSFTVGNANALFGSRFPEMTKRDDWARTTYVLGPAEQILQNNEARISGYRESINNVSFHVSANSLSSRVLVATSIVQDGGWTARDGEGRTLETTLANGPFLAVWAPPRAGLVYLDYSPPGFRTGILLSLATLFLISVCSIWARRRNIP